MPTAAQIGNASVVGKPGHLNKTVPNQIPNQMTPSQMAAIKAKMSLAQKAEKNTAYGALGAKAKMAEDAPWTNTTVLTNWIKMLLVLSAGTNFSTAILLTPYTMTWAMFFAVVTIANILSIVMWDRKEIERKRERGIIY